MINIAICDDEPYILDEIRGKVADFMKNEKLISNIMCFESGNALLSSAYDFDVIFLDIGMDGTDGMKAARELRKRSFKGFLIFVTSLEEYVYDSFEVSAYDYLVKPVSDEKIRKTLSRMLSELKENLSENLIIRSGGDSSIIPIKDIVFFEVIDKKIYIHTVFGEIITYYERLENLESKLDRHFFKCHRSYLINLRNVKSFGKKTVQMNTGEKIPVSRLRFSSLETAVADYISRSGDKL